MGSSKVIAAAMPAWALGIAAVAVAAVAITIVVVVMFKRRAGADNAPARRNAVAPPSNSETPVVLQNRLRNLQADLDMVLKPEPVAPPFPSVPSATTQTVERGSAPVVPPVAQAPVAQPAVQAYAVPRVADDATRFFGTASGDAEAANGPAAPDVSDDALRHFGPSDDDALLSPAQTRYFSPAELVDQDEAAGFPFGQTGMLQALPPKRDDTGETLNTIATPARSVTPAIDNVQAYLRTVTAPEVLALSVIDGHGQVLAGADDEDVAGELRALLAESDRGALTDVVQPLRFADDSRGAIFLLPTGAEALLGALVREEDLQETRTYLRDVAAQIGDTLRAAS